MGVLLQGGYYGEEEPGRKEGCHLSQAGCCLGAGMLQCVTRAEKPVRPRANAPT